MRDETGTIVGADCIGTLSYADARFKQVKSGSKRGYGYNTGERQSPRYIAFFESAVDLLSFAAIEQGKNDGLGGYLLMSMAGLKPAIVSTALDVFGRSMATPIFCVGNDEAGATGTP